MLHLTYKTCDHQYTESTREYNRMVQLMELVGEIIERHWIGDKFGTNYTIILDKSFLWFRWNLLTISSNFYQKGN